MPLSDSSDSKIEICKKERRLEVIKTIAYSSSELKLRLRLIVQQVVAQLE